jgi:hypothetical protein
MSSDDTFLSAYLDGELDPDQQQLVDSALVSHPELAERLRALSAVHDLVVSLPREGGVDVAPQVMNRIRKQRQSRWGIRLARPWAFEHSRAAVLAGMLTTSVAAALLVVFVANRSQKPLERNDALAARGAQERERPGQAELAASEAATYASPEPEILSPTDLAAAKSKFAILPAADGQHVLADSRGGNRSNEVDSEFARKVIELPHRRHVFLSKTGGDGKSQERLVNVVEHTTRFGFYKISISQGIVIDPRHPEEATVFALLVNPNQLDRLREQLRVALPDLVEEPTADPAVVTQLADIDRIQTFASAPLGDVSIGRDDLALKVPLGSGSTDADGQAAIAVAQAVVDQPTAEQYRSAPLPIPARTGDGAESQHNPALADADRGNPARRDRKTSAVPSPTSPGARLETGAPALTAAKSDETILVFVWICKPRAS